MNEAVKKILEIQSNQGNNQSNTTYTYFKFNNFLSTIDQVILSNL